VAEHLRGEGLICYPTETVYGLGCALVPAALERLAALKARNDHKPFLLLVAGRESLPGLHWTAEAAQLAEVFWPGPLTLALRAESDAYPRWVVGERGTVAVRWSPHPGIGAVIEALGSPLTSTSANLPGAPPATSAEEAMAVVRALGDPAGLWLLDGGPLPASAPSTIVDCSGRRPRILRAGAIGPELLRTVVGDLDV
jgi:L-threonylcarbamoyladenylate synthase